MPNASGGHWIRTKRRLAIYARDAYRCVWCREPVERGRNATLDHFLPRELGGGNETENLVTACFGCNSARKHSPALLWAYRIAGPLFAWQVLERALEQIETPIET